MLDPRGIGDVDEPCLVEPELGHLLITLGFSAAAPVYRTRPVEPFTNVFQGIVDGLCGQAKYMIGPPVGLECRPSEISLLRRDRRNGPWLITIFPDLVQAVPEPYRLAAGGPTVTGKYGAVTMLNRHAHPSWYIRGTLISERAQHNDAVGPTVRFHGYIQSDPEAKQPDWPHGMIVQLVKIDAEAKPDDELMWGIGLPTWPNVATPHTLITDSMSV